MIELQYTILLPIVSGIILFIFPEKRFKIKIHCIFSPLPSPWARCCIALKQLRFAHGAVLSDAPEGA